LLQTIDPWLLAGLLYVGSGLGLTIYRQAMRAARVQLARARIVGLWAQSWRGRRRPVLLMFGLKGMLASSASLLLTAEGAFTALLAWFVFKENFDRRIALGMASILAGAAVLAWPDELRIAGLWPALAVLGACLAWGIDNNLTRKVALTDATWIASVRAFLRALSIWRLR
jgi:drug/metabolite transporter (DMT)-like permease